MDYVIFSIDKDHDLHQKAKFLRHMDTLRSMGKLSDTMVVAIGSYKGKLESSYIVSERDFNQYVLGSSFVDNQESFMFVGPQSWMPYWIETNYTELTVKEGNLRSLSYLPNGIKDWTYRPDLNLYWFDAKEVF